MFEKITIIGCGLIGSSILRNINNNKISEIRAKYIIGCDGARSTIRKQIKAKFQNLGFTQKWAVVDLILKKNKKVFLVDNLSTGHKKLINKKAKFFKLDIANKHGIKKIIEKLSSEMKVNKNEIFLASTGVIGEPLDHKKIISKIPYLIKNQKNNSESWEKAANAIRTTDTFSKYFRGINKK